MTANIYANKKKLTEPYYAYFTLGLTAKIVGALGLAFVYTIYYPGGDTTEYFRNVTSLEGLALFDFVLDVFSGRENQGHRDRYSCT